MDVYIALAKSHGGEPDAGQKLKSWALQAGFLSPQIYSTAGIWCFADPPSRQYWSQTRAERTQDSTFSKTTVELGLCTPDDIELFTQAWKTWGDMEDGWFVVVHGEIVCKK